MIVDGRICIRAVLLCLYASIVKLLGTGEPLYWDRLTFALAGDLAIVNLSDESMERGFVAFEYVPGMPLWPFLRSMNLNLGSLPLDRDACRS